MTECGVRNATSADLDRITELAEQLGYPSSRARLAERWTALSADPTRALVVAVLEGERDGKDPRVVGWLEFGVRDSFLSGRFGEIHGLVVDSRIRRAGIGRRLVAWAEAETKRRGLSRLRLTSNSERVEAASFYPALGFRQTKLSRVFEKSWAVSADTPT
jgi:ribosomal protein S18 acetylase RimI-like enzyme